MAVTKLAVSSSTFIGYDSNASYRHSVFPRSYRHVLPM